MAKRWKTNKKKDSKWFTLTARKSNRRNLPKRHARGGISL